MITEVLVTSRADAGGVFPPNQIVVPLSSENEYGPGKLDVCTRLMTRVDGSKVVTVNVGKVAVSAPESIAGAPWLAAKRVLITGDAGKVTKDVSTVALPQLESELQMSSAERIALHVVSCYF